MNPGAFLGRVAKQSLAAMWAFRSSSLLVVLFGALFALSEVVAAIIFYRFTPTIAGWRFDEFLTLVATANLVNHGYQLLFVLNHEELLDRILDGALDYDLVRPVDSQLLVSIRRLDWPSALNLLLAAALLVYATRHLPHASLASVVLFAGLGVLGVGLLYALNQLAVSVAFWADRPRRITGAPESLMELGGGPAGVYPRALQYALSSVLPVVAATNLPVTALWGGVPLWQATGFVLGVAALMGAARWVWQRGLTRYTSAS